MAAKLTVAGVTASGDDGNVPRNTIDGDTATRWSANGDGQWIQWDLGSVQSLSQVQIAFYKGDSRINTFDIEVSDGTTSTRVLQRHTSSGTTTDLEAFDVTPVTGRYVRYTGHGSDVGLWNSLTEAELWSPDGQQGEAAVRFGWGAPLPQWSDEFTYTGAPDPAKWTVSTGAGPVGQRTPERVSVDGAKLVGTGNSTGDHFALASGLNRRYGRWEVRARSFNVGSPTSGQTLGVGGVATPAGAIVESGDRGAFTISSGGTASNPKVYDGKGFNSGRITVHADNVVVQNYRINANGQYGAVLDGNNITFQNNDIRNVHAPGDLNAITAWGNGMKIRYNTAVNFVTGDPGSSHTDFIQTWVSSSHPVASANWEIVGNKAVCPANPSRTNSVPSIHQCVMAEGFGRGGNSGGSGADPSNWIIADNEFGDSWNQAIKLDGVDNVSVTRNKFVGSSDKVMDVSAASSNVKFYSDNVVGSGYPSVGVSITPGAGPATPGGAAAGTATLGHYHPYLGIWSNVTPWPTDGEYDFLANKAPGEQTAGADLRFPSTAADPAQLITPAPSKAGVDLTQFHNYGFEWTPSGLAGYLDGEMWFTATGGAISGTRRDIQTMSAGHLAIVLNNVTGLHMQPAQFEVEWVRIYNPAPAPE